MSCSRRKRMVLAVINDATEEPYQTEETKTLEDLNDNSQETKENVEPLQSSGEPQSNEETIEHESSFTKDSDDSLADPNYVQSHTSASESSESENNKNLNDVNEQGNSGTGKKKAREKGQSHMNGRKTRPRFYVTLEKRTPPLRPRRKNLKVGTCGRHVTKNVVKNASRKFKTIKDVSFLKNTGGSKFLHDNVILYRNVWYRFSPPIATKDQEVIDA